MRELDDRFENGINLVFQLGSEPTAARLVIIDLVIDLGDRESMDSKLQRLARAALRWRMWVTHDPELAERTDRTLHLIDGKLAP